MFQDISVELCAGTSEDAKLALAFPIDRIELNCALELGGLTPGVSSLRRVKDMCDLPVVCMVRPRGGDFVYGEELFALMREEARLLLENGADGIVFGFLKSDRTIDRERTAALAEIAHAYGKTAVFHRAFDEARDPLDAAETLASLGIDRLLTSGQETSALAGSSLLAKLIHAFQGRMEILPGAGIRAENVRETVRTTNTKWIHLSAGAERPDHTRRFDPDRLSAVLTELKKR